MCTAVELLSVESACEPCLSLQLIINNNLSLLFFIEPGPSSGNCLLNKGKFDYIKTKENCTSRIKYQHNTCRGTCESTSTSTYGETGLDSFCACCQPSVGKLWTATLDCPNNEVRSTNFFEIRACRCRQFKCVSEQDKSGMEEINEKGQVVDVNQQSVGRRLRR